MIRSFVVVLAIAITVPLTASALSLAGQDRSITAYASSQPSFGSPTTQTDSATAPDFGPFSDSVSAGVGFVSSGAQQDSTILLGSDSSLQVDASGHASSSSWNFIGENTFGTTNGRSSFELTFTLDTAVAYALTVSIFGSSLDGDSTLPGQMSASVDLMEQGGALIAQLARSSTPGTASSFDETMSFSGVLAPGTYVLRGVATSQAVGDQYYPDLALGSGTFDFSFMVAPEPSTAVLMAVGLVGLAVRTHR